jgi:hypothetical protein
LFIFAEKRILSKIQPFFLFFLFSCLLFFRGINSFAKEQNPFERTFQQGEKKTVPFQSDNPFDKVKPEEEKQLDNIGPKPILTKKSADFFLLIGLLLLLAIFLTFLRPFAIKAMGALGTENLFNFLYREMTGRGILPYLLLYLFSIIQLGVFLYLSLPLFSEQLKLVVKLDFFFFLALPILILAVKHVLLTFIGFIFPVKKEMDRYQFLMVVAVISMGLILSPMNIFSPFLNDYWGRILIYGALILIGAIWAYHYFRGLSIGVRFIGSHLFHFLLYICTVEIAPVLFLVKWINNSL